MRTAALLWLLAVLAAIFYLVVRIAHGIEFQTDLLALLPQEERDSGVLKAKKQVAGIHERRAVVLVGHRSKAIARAGGEALASQLRDSGLLESVSYRMVEDDRHKLGQTLFQYRHGLLAPTDRLRLLENREHEITARALGAYFSPGGIGDSRLLQHDPFLLLPSFLSELPSLLPRAVVDEGILSIQTGDKTYVLITVQVRPDAFALSAQSALVARFDTAERATRARLPDLEIVRTGALFYAHAAAQIAIAETSWIGAASVVGTVLLVLVVFRAHRPLTFSLLAILTGIVTAFSASLWLFDSLHVAALLFGVSLIGIAVDYSLHYTCEGLGSAELPAVRMRRIFPGLFLGLATTLVGYLMLLWAPFPGLHQVGAFVAIGLTASFITVVLWLPLLDRGRSLRPPDRLLAAAGFLWQFWENPQYRRLQAIAVGACTLFALLGAARFSINDDVRRLQSLPAPLQHQETEIRRLTGSSIGGRFILVRGRDAEAVLQAEEALLARLATAIDGARARIHAISQVIPSRARQSENMRLVDDKLSGALLDDLFAKIGGVRPAGPARDDRMLTLGAIESLPPLSFLRDLVVENGPEIVSHLVLVDSVIRADRLRALAKDVEGVTVIDPADDFSALLGAYRRRALALLALSAALVMPILVWRYGVRGSLGVMLPPAAAIAATPALVALGGAPFTFFNAMALILVFSIGIDYAIFCKEAEAQRLSSTLLGTWMAALTTIMSFGMLAFSSVYAVHAFGITLSVGIVLAFLLSPLAGIRPTPLRGGAKR